MRMPQGLEYLDLPVQILFEFLVESFQLDRLDGDGLFGVLYGQAMLVH